MCIRDRYIISVSRLNLTYDEFEALSEKEQLEYLNRVAAWVLSIIPEVELEAGLYEVSVPLGVDMTATYCVSVKGTTNFGNQSTVGLTIEQQKIVLQSFKVSSDNLVSEDSDIYAKGASNSVGIGPVSYTHLYQNIRNRAEPKNYRYQEFISIMASKSYTMN